MAKIKGKWQWNETLPLHSKDLQAWVDFTCCGQNCDVIYVYSNPSWYSEVRYEINDIAVAIAAVSEEGGSTMTVDPVYRIMDFGETEQEISEDFYYYLVANATQVCAIQGKWKWNETLPHIDYSGPIYIDFTSNETEFNRIECVEGLLGYYYESNPGVMASGYINGTICTAEEYRIMDFGTDEQEIDYVFYNYLVANSEPYYAVKGKWRWNEVINFPSLGTYDVNITFISNGLTYIRLTIYDDQYTGNYGLIYEDFTFLTRSADQGVDSLEVYDEYRVIDFGSTEREIDENFYDFLITNAAQLPDNFVVTTKNYIVSGQLLSDIGDAMREISFTEYFALSELPQLIRDITAIVRISFTIDGVEYRAMKGMTWEEWCNTPWNRDKFYCQGWVYLSEEEGYIKYDYGHGATPGETIMPGHVYSIGWE